MQPVTESLDSAFHDIKLAASASSERGGVNKLCVYFGVGEKTLVVTFIDEIINIV